MMFRLPASGRGARGPLHLRKSPVLESVSFFSFGAANLRSKLGLVVVPLLKQARSKKDSSILATLDFLLISCQLHVCMPPAFSSASSILLFLSLPAKPLFHFSSSKECLLVSQALVGRVLLSLVTALTVLCSHCLCDCFISQFAP